MAGREQEAGSIGDAAVKAATGKGWKGWFGILEKANTAAMPHKKIVQLLHENHGVPGWWAQMITVEYERAHGGRQLHQKMDGFSVSISKTISVALPRLYRAVAEERQRKQWFPGTAFVPSSMTQDKYVRGSWGKNGARLEIGFYAKAEGKSQVSVQVNKMPEKSDVERERAAWKKALGKLETILDR